jgi:replicative DNA helicase
MAMHSFEEEQQFLATLINHPDSFVEISSVISEEDFYSESSQVNKTIFSILKRSIESGNQIDYVMLTERALSLNLSFEDDINIGDYIQALSLRKTNPKTIIGLAKDLKKYAGRRTITKCAKKIINIMTKASSEEALSDLVDLSDQEYNGTISLFDNGSNIPEDLFADMESYVEERGNNPVEEFGLLGPHKRIHELYGSLLRPGNITTITARSGVGKTQFCLDFCLKTSQLNNFTPILHFDNGEMSKEELRMRLCASMSGVPLHLIETGKWRRNSNTEAKVRSVWSKIKNYNLHYYNVSGMSVDQMVNLVKRFYYSKVGRGNNMILNFDYIKTTSENFNNKTEWQVIGEMVDKFKRLVQSDILFDGEPMVAMMTSVQSNRTGITNNRRADTIVEDESIVSGSDRINQFSSHLFSLRKRTREELAESPDFGTHKLSCFKHRHLGSEYMRAIEKVRLADGISLSDNAIFLNFDNFNITEVGDLVDLVNTQNAEADINLNTNPDELPDI